jgi:hypothetical protein
MIGNACQWACLFYYGETILLVEGCEEWDVKKLAILSPCHNKIM